jgi:hypothetical protein
LVTSGFDGNEPRATTLDANISVPIQVNRLGVTLSALQRCLKLYRGTGTTHNAAPGSARTKPITIPLPSFTAPLDLPPQQRRVESLWRAVLNPFCNLSEQGLVAVELPATPKPSSEQPWDILMYWKRTRC